jgi:muramoyltetrapeptide carboxypeptidase
MSALFRTKPAKSNSSLIPLARVMPNAGMRIIAPASSAKVEAAQVALAKLRSMSFQPRFGQNAFRKGPLFFAGTTTQRLQDLHDAFTDENSTVVVCLRGGYGSNYLLEGLDTELIRRNPKPFLAYSDLTAIQLQLLDRIGLPAFHGPMAATDFALDGGVHVESLLAALGGTTYSVGDSEGLRTLKMGALDKPATGTLYGGCLSILVSLLGTPWEPQTEGKLLFLEDTGAKPYQIDRMLWQLRHAGKLEGIKGVIFGEMLDCSSPGASSNLLEEVILQHFEDMEIPIAIGLRSGHVSRHNVTLVFGWEAELRMTGFPQLTLQGIR